MGENITALLNAATSNSSYKVDHIAYTAGDTLILRTLGDVDLYYLKSLFLVRSFAAVLLTKLAAKHIASSRSSSITFSSGASDIRPLPGRPVLAMLTGSFRGLIRGLAISLKPVRVNAVSLGAVNTSALQSTWSDKSPEEEHEILGLFKAQTVTGEIAELQDVAEAFVYFMRDHNVTGVSVDTDSGRHFL